MTSVANPADGPDFGGLIIPPRQLDLLRAAVEIEQQDAREAGSMVFLARVFCQSALPYRNPGDDVGSWSRQNGNLTFHIQPRSKGRPGEPERYGWAYGVVPRLLMVWMTTQVIQDGPAVEDRTIKLGDSLRDFFANLGMASTGGRTGSIRRIREQVTNLAMSSIRVERFDPAPTPDGYTEFRAVSTSIASKLFMCWSARDQLGSEALFGPTITLAPDMYELMKTTGVPLDNRALQRLRTRGGGGLAIDIYTWLAHRLAYLSRPTLVPWELLSLQFGSQYKRLRDFKARFEKPFKEARLAYPAANAELLEYGVYLRPSPPAVPRKALRG